MEQNQPENKSTSKATSRRKFLQRASAGLLVASIPAQSVWATGGLSGSIVASGAGSRLGEIPTIALQSPGRFMNRAEYASERARKFSEVFGTNAKPFSNTGFHPDVTLGEILQPPGQSGLSGPSNVNFLMVGMYFNALDSAYSETPHPMSGVYYPVVGAPPRYFSSAEAFAAHLYNLAVNNPAGLGSELGLLIDQNHA